jgi:hypothetical protein
MPNSVFLTVIKYIKKVYFVNNVPKAHDPFSFTFKVRLLYKKTHILL